MTINMIEQMASIQIPIPQNFQDDFIEKLKYASIKAIETAKEQDAMYTKEWLKQSEACAWLGISYNTLQGFRSKGLQIATISGITLISKKEINRFLEEHY